MSSSKIKNTAIAVNFLFLFLTVVSVTKARNDFFTNIDYLHTPRETNTELVLPDNQILTSGFNFFSFRQNSPKESICRKYYSSIINRFYTFQFNQSQLLILKNQPAVNEYRIMLFEQIQNSRNYKNSIDDPLLLS
jgi:hypothetical protein